MTVMAVGGEEAVVAMTSSGVDDGLGLSRAAGRLTKIEGSGGVVLCDSARAPSWKLPVEAARDAQSSSCSSRMLSVALSKKSKDAFGCRTSWPTRDFATNSTSNTPRHVTPATPHLQDPSFCAEASAPLTSQSRRAVQEAWHGRRLGARQRSKQKEKSPMNLRRALVVIMTSKPMISSIPQQPTRMR